MNPEPRRAPAAIETVTRLVIAIGAFQLLLVTYSRPLWAQPAPFVFYGIGAVLCHLAYGPRPRPEATWGGPRS